MGAKDFGGKESNEQTRQHMHTPIHTNPLSDDNNRNSTVYELIQNLNHINVMKDIRKLRLVK